MTRWVVDASVAAKWFFPEEHTLAACRLLGNDSELLAPDLLYAEFGNILWKRWRRGELESVEARTLLRDLRRFPLAIHAADTLLDSAWDIAFGYNRTMYDSLYLALALKAGCPLVTADLRFYNALRDTPLGASLLWVADVP